MKITPEFSYFCGIIAGDGYVGNGPIEIKGENIGFLNDVYKPLVEKIYNKRPRISKENSANAFRAWFYSREICNEIKKIFNFGKSKTYSVRMPLSIRKSNIKNKIEFCRGVFDTDGSIYLRKDLIKKGYPVINLSSRSLYLIDDVKSVFDEIKIKIRKTSYKKRGIPMYELRLYGRKKLKMFKENVDFKHPKKLNILNTVINTSFV